MAWIIVAFIALLLFGLYTRANRENKTLNEKIRKDLGTSYIELSDGITHYELAGPEDGQAVVLIHGGTVPMFDFDMQVPALVTAGFRVLRYDQYGRGFSDRPHCTYNRKFYCKQLLELLDALELYEPVDIIGHCFGSAIGITFAASHPERIHKFVLHSPMINSITDQTGFILARLPLFGRYLTRAILVPQAVKRADNLFTPMKEGKEQFIDLFEQQTHFKGFEHSLYSMCVTDAMRDYTQEYKVVGKQKKDFMMIWGNSDNNISREMINDIMNIIPDTSFHEFDGVGHSPNLEKTEEFNRLIVEFLKKQ
jgi:pimeloyl-ACP methyl ester carboxylesterase